MGLGTTIRSNDLRDAAFAPDAAMVDQACEGFHRRFRKLSAKYVLSIPQTLILAALLGGLVSSIVTWPMLAWRVAHAVAFALFAIAIAWRWIAASSLERLRTPLFTPAPGESWPIYTILCPLHREANVVFDLVAGLKRLDYPAHALDIQLLVEADDLETIAAALAAATPRGIEVVIVPAAHPRTKPKAINIGLARARGEFIVVYDAEDRPHPLQLRAAVAAFREAAEDLACVQAPLAIDNGAVSWISRQFAAEYAIQFREILPLLARLKLPMPLGGTSNHFRTEALRGAGGWDPYNVTEDAELGYRLGLQGRRVGVIAPPTWEEAPITLGAWIKQRTRWIKGHIQTWLVLMRDPIATARGMGWRAFWSMHLVLGGGVLATLLHGPLALLLLFAIFSPLKLLGLADIVLALTGYVVAVFAALTASALSGDLSHTRAAPTMPFYWPLASIAAAWAVLELIFRPHHWAKTKHGVSQRPRGAIALQRAEEASPDAGQREAS